MVLMSPITLSPRASIAPPPEWPICWYWGPGILGGGPRVLGLAPHLVQGGGEGRLEGLHRMPDGVPEPPKGALDPGSKAIGLGLGHVKSSARVLAGGGAQILDAARSLICG